MTAPAFQAAGGSTPAAALRGLALAIALALAPPALAEPVAFTARSIDEAAEGQLPQITDVTSSEAVLRFRSAIPMACSVVYGPTEDFGMIATDDDMDGGAHSDHEPVLSGLAPDTRYFYRVQGTAADGTLYLGEVQVFRTLPATDAGPTNLASLAAGARVVAVSSNWGGAANDEAWGAHGALDGSRSTAWSSAGDGDKAFIEIEIAERSAIGSVAIWSRSMSDGTARIESFTLTDETGNVFGPFSLPDTDRTYHFPVATTTQRLRFDVIKSTGGNTGLVELGVFAE